jgi:hypothetical protein
VSKKNQPLLRKGRSPVRRRHGYTRGNASSDAPHDHRQRLQANDCKQSVYDLADAKIGEISDVLLSRESKIERRTSEP